MKDISVKWLPIESAPKNGIVIISNCGFIKWTNVNFDRVIDHSTWYECYPDGELKYEYENIQYSYPIVANPMLWLDIEIPIM